jgi:glycosyltransferase 2 family protein
LRRFGLGAVGLLLSAAAVVLLVAIVDLEATWRALRGTHLGWLAATLLMIPAQIFLRSARWRLLLPRKPDGQRPAVTRVAPVLMTGYLGNLLLPARLGEPVRAYLVARREQLRFTPALGSVLLERVIDLATLSMVAFVAALLAGAPTWMVRGIGVVAIFGLIALMLLVVLGIPRVVHLTTRLLGDRSRRLAKPIGLLVSFGEGAGGEDRRVVSMAIGLSALTWVFVATGFWLVGQSLGLGLTPAAALLIAAVTVLGTAIPAAPGHIGTFEVAALVSATALGVSSSDALALALLAHAASTLPLAAAGVVAIGWMSVSLRSVADEAGAAVRSEPAFEGDRG